VAPKSGGGLAGEVKMAATTYTIYIVNQSATKQTFWCFPAPPQELANDPGVDANSGALLAVSLNNQGNANFAVPAQGDVEAGDEEAGVNPEIVSDVTGDASLRQPFEVSYLTMQLTEQSSPGSSPLTYYITTGHDITTGSDGSDALASGVERSSNLIAITIPDSFQNQSCTVRYDAPGRWSESPGEPVTQALTSSSEGGVQADIIKNVSWNQATAVEGKLTVLSGTLTVTTALVARFTYFVLSGVEFSVVNSQPGQATFELRYSGSKSAAAVKSLFRAGAQLLLGGAGKS
jgi:hypothetical protein